MNAIGKKEIGIVGDSKDDLIVGEFKALFKKGLDLRTQTAFFKGLFHECTVVRKYESMQQYKNLYSQKRALEVLIDAKNAYNNESPWKNIRHFFLKFFNLNADINEAKKLLTNVEAKIIELEQTESKEFFKKENADNEQKIFSTILQRSITQEENTEHLESITKYAENISTEYQHNGRAAQKLNEIQQQNKLGTSLFCNSFLNLICAKYNAGLNKNISDVKSLDNGEVHEIYGNQEKPSKIVIRKPNGEVHEIYGNQNNPKKIVMRKPNGDFYELYRNLDKGYLKGEGATRCLYEGLMYKKRQKSKKIAILTTLPKEGLFYTKNNEMINRRLQMQIK